MPARHLYSHHYLKTLGEAELRALAERCRTWGMNEAEFALRISAWLDNFDEARDWPLAVKLVLALEYHSEAGFHQLLRQRHEMVQRHLLKKQLDPQRVLFAVPDDLADSATRHAHPLSKVWQLPNERFVAFAQLAQVSLGGEDSLILFNDTYGSGKQFMREVWPRVEPLLAQVGAVLIVGAAIAQEALDLFAREARGAQLIPNYPVASVHHLPGFTAAEVARLRELGQMVYGKHPLGFGSCGLLLAYHFQCPNNSLPLIWADGENSAQDGQHRFPWRPLFPYLAKAKVGRVAALGQERAPVPVPASAPLSAPAAGAQAQASASVSTQFVRATALPQAPASALHEPEAKPAWASDHGQDEYGWWADLTVSGVSQRMRYIRAGQFVMGALPNEAGRRDNEVPRHKVTISHGFWLADSACSQSLWQVVMGNNPSYFQGKQGGGPLHPVEQVSWYDVQGFLHELNLRLPAGQATLPTEAEWEYACRAGTTTPFWFGASINPAQANYNGNEPYGTAAQGEFRECTVAVQALPCNGWGLYQMHGNVWEWCADALRTYTTAAVIDPGLEDAMALHPDKPPDEAQEVLRALRGGSWIYVARWLRSACRGRDRPVRRDRGTGFRLALRSSGTSR